MFQNYTDFYPGKVILITYLTTNNEQSTNNLVNRYAETYEITPETPTDKRVEYSLKPESAEEIGKGTTCRAFLIDKNTTSPKIFKFFWPEMVFTEPNHHHLHLPESTDRNYENIKDKFRQRLDSFLRSFESVKKVYEQYQENNVIQISQELWDTSLGLCVISPLYGGEKFTGTKLVKKENLREQLNTIFKEAKQVLDDLEMFHSCGVLNGDIKQDNLWKINLSQDPPNTIVRALDFGNSINLVAFLDKIKTKKEEAEKNYAEEAEKNDTEETITVAELVTAYLKGDVNNKYEPNFKSNYIKEFCPYFISTPKYYAYGDIERAIFRCYAEDNVIGQESKLNGLKSLDIKAFLIMLYNMLGLQTDDKENDLFHFEGKNILQTISFKNFVPDDVAASFANYNLYQKIFSLFKPAWINNYQIEEFPTCKDLSSRIKEIINLTDSPNSSANKKFEEFDYLLKDAGFCSLQDVIAFSAQNFDNKIVETGKLIEKLILPEEK